MKPMLRWASLTVLSTPLVWLWPAVLARPQSGAKATQERKAPSKAAVAKTPAASQARLARVYRALADRIPPVFAEGGATEVIMLFESGGALTFVPEGKGWKVKRHETGLKLVPGTVKVSGRVREGTKLPDGSFSLGGNLMYDLSGQPTAGKGGLLLAVEEEITKETLNQK